MEQKITPRKIIEHLQTFAKEQGLKGGTEAARNTIRIELQNHVLDLLDLPKEKRDALKTLLAKRMRVIDNSVLAKKIQKVSVQDALTIFGDLHEQIKEHHGLFQSHTPINWREYTPLLEREIGELRKINEVKKKVPFDLSLQTPQEGHRSELIEAAKQANGILLYHHLGENYTEFNNLTTSVMQDYVNKHYPASLADLIEAFEKKKRPEKE